MKKTNPVLKILRLFVFVAFIALFALTFGSRLFGLTPYSIQSGSMEPNYPVGSLIYVQAGNTDSIKISDVITFKNSTNSLIVTHRVVRIDSEKKLIYTKGDANSTEDPSPVSFSEVIGKPVFTLPVLGYILTFLSAPLGKILTILIALLLLAALYAPDLIRWAKHGDDEKTNT